MDLGVSGLASGFDWRTLVDQLAQAERAPEQRLQSDQATIQQRNAAYGKIQTQLETLNTRLTTLTDASFFTSRLTQTSDSTHATATAAASATLGQFVFDIQQLATASKQQGTANIGGALNATSDVSSLALNTAGFNTPITDGTFTVNGKQVTIAATDTLQAVFGKISTATGGAVTGSYDPTSDKISLTSSSAIVLGSATDTSNFLQVAKLSNNGTGSISSATALGSIRLGASLASANFTTPLTDGGAGAGELKINGVSIQYNASADSVAAVLDRINTSTAGVTASYDAVNDRFTLVSKATGDMGIALEDVTGNFLAATGLSGGTLQRGQDLLYTVNNGGQLRSQSNTISEATSGVAGLSVTALDKGAVTISVNSDTAKIKQGITDFLAAYNQVQTLIDSQTASTTDAQGKVTAGLLAGEMDANDIASQLRRLTFGQATGLTSAIKSLSDLGIDSSGDNNSLTLADSTKLDDALANNLTGVAALFTDKTYGLTATLGGYLGHTVGDNGTLVTKQDNLTKQSAAIDTQVANMERVILDDRQRMIDSFVAMESAQQKANQQLQYLQQRFGSSSSG